jgi:two-component sensor histidine kinase
MKILSAIYSSIGNIKNSQKDDPKALEYYFLSLEMDKKMGANEGIAINYKNIGDVYLSQKKYEDALSYFSKTLDIRQNMGDKKSIPSLYNSIGAVYSELKNYNKSREYYDKVIESAYSNKSSLFVSYTNISEGFLNQNMLIDAKSWADKALGIAKEIGEDIENFEKIYQLLSQIQHLQGNYLDAYENYKQYILYRDSLYNEENTKKIVETEMLYEFDKKEIATQASFQKSQDSLKLVQQKAIELQQLENEYQSKYALAKNNEERLQLLYEEDLKRQEIENNFQQQQIKNNASQKKNQAIKQAEYEKELLIQASKRRNSILILSSISALLLLSGGFVYWRFQTKKKEAQRLDVKNQKIETLVKELHHRVKNNMQIISSLLSLQSSKTDSADVKEAFHDGINRVQAMGLIHQKLYMSEDITQVNMKEYIESLSENLISSYAISGRSVKLQKDLKDISLNIDTAVPLGLILNELLTNALKYGTTNTLPEISISFDGSLLIIKDNGIKNFHPDQHRDSNSFGLKLIQILCKQIRAQLTYYQNNGTECRIKLGV